MGPIEPSWYTKFEKMVNGKVGYNIIIFNKMMKRRRAKCEGN